MKLLSTYLRGKSLTVCFAFPEDYDMANMDDLNVSIGSKQFTGDDIDISGQVACVRLKSEDTYKLAGDYPIIISIDDKTRGVIPIYVGDIRFVTHRNTLNNASTNEQNDIVIALSITQTTIDVDSILYNVMKGDKGEQGEKGDKGDKGDAGDMFSGQFNTVILKQNCVWVDGWLWIDTGSKLNPFGSISTVKKVDVGYMAISTGIGTEQLKPIVHYPSSTQNEPANQANGFYLKDADGRLSENTDFEHIDLRYNILPDNVFKYDGLTTLKKGGFVLEEAAGESYHSKYGIFAFDAVYPEYTGVKIESRLDPLTMTYITQHFTPTYCRKRNVNLISKPYSVGALTESEGSNPDILTVAAHWGNTFERRDLTASATTFLQNVIAVGSCGDGEPDPDTWTSYGYGMEFSERGNNLGLNADYPTETFPHAVGYGTGSGNTFTDSTGTRNYENMLQVEIGAKIKIGLTYETAVEYTLAGLSGNTFTTVETLSLQPGTNYVYIDALIGTAWQTAADNQKYVQSPVCSIVAAKFRKIQDMTGASWDTIRLACRATASNGGTWDMYRGFGVIDVDAAIQYIKDNYTENNDYLNNLADEVERTRGIDPMLPYAKKTDNTPVTKGEFEPVRDKIAGIEDNANNYIHPPTHAPAIIEQDANNRFVTDAEKSTWNAKQNALGFTPENAANKQNSLAVDGTGAKYPTVDTLNDNFRKYYPVIPYANRILADSGVINDISALTKLYVENLKLLDNTVFLWGSSAGMKTRTSGINQYATKLYDMSSGNKDAAQATEANQPFVGGGIAPNEKSKIKAVTGGTVVRRMVISPAISFSSGDEWSVSFVANNTGQIATTGIIGNFADRGILNDTNRWQFRDYSNGDIKSIEPSNHNTIVGKNQIITLVAKLNNIYFFRNGSLLQTTPFTSTQAVFSSFLNGYNTLQERAFRGEMYSLQIFNKALSASEVQAQHAYLRLQYPEIEGINIGNRHWATSNYEGVVTGNGTVIPNVTGTTTAINPELVTNGTFDTATGWILTGATTISGGALRVYSPDGSASSARFNIPTIVVGKRYLLKYDVLQNNGGQISCTDIGTNLIDTTVGVNKTFEFNAADAGYFILKRITACDVTFDNVSLKEVGWADLTTPAWCYYNNDPLNGAVYGKEYNLYGAQAINLNAPTGYTIGTYAQWLQMVTLLGGISVAGNKMKLNGTALWAVGNLGTNESGFTALPNGQRNADGTFSQLNNKANFWTSDGYLVTLDYNAATVTFTSGADAKIGAAVRLLRNEPVGDNERTINTGYITNALGATNLDISIPFGYQVESIRFDSETNITGLSAKLYTGALLELETLFTAKSVTSNVQKIISADADQSIQQTDAVVRINGTKADTTKRFRVWIKLTKVVFS